MIKAIFKSTSVALLFAGVFFSSCQSSAQKSDTAEAKVMDAKQDLQEAQKDANIAAQKAVDAEEWKVFKADTELKIKDNDTRIAELKAKMKTSGKKLDAAYVESIDVLEQKNKDLKNRMDAYSNNTQSDWNSFKREFNHDMDELGKALKDLTVNNKK